MSKFNEVLARNTQNAPKQICDFSQTVAFSHYNHLSAQLPIDPSTGEIVSGGIKEQALQCFRNIEAIVRSISHTLEDIVRLTICTKSVADIQAVKEVYKTAFTSYMPTMTTVVVKNLPMNAQVSIEAVITCGEGTIPNAPQAGDLVKVVRNTTGAPQCSTCSQSVAFSHYNNITCQYPLDPKTNKLVAGDFKAQLKQALKNTKAILESIDVPFDDIVKMNVYVKDIKLLAEIKEVYTTFFPDSAIARTVGYFPALSIIEVADICHNASVQVEAVVSHGDGTPPQAVEDRHGIVIEPANTTKAPRCEISTQSVAFSHYNNISSQYPIDLKSNKLVSDDFSKQVSHCLDSIGHIVKNVDHKLSDVVKLNIFVTDISKIDIVHNVLKSYFKTMPAGRIVEVGNIAFGAQVQIDAVVANAEGTPPIK